MKTNSKMMRFQCFKCSKNSSHKEKIIKHLKIEHTLKDHTEQLKCIVKESKCDFMCLTFRGLTAHVNKCVLRFENENNENTNTPTTMLGNENCLDIQVSCNIPDISNVLAFQGLIFQ